MDKFLSNNIIFYGAAILLGSGIGIIVGLARPNLDEPSREQEPSGVSETPIVGKEEQKEEKEEQKEEKKEQKEEKKEKQEEKVEEKKEEKAAEQKPQIATPSSNTIATNNSSNVPKSTSSVINGPMVCRYNYASQAIGIEPATCAGIATWDGLTVNAFNQLMAYGHWVSPRQPEQLGIDMGDTGGTYNYGGGWTGNKSGWTFTANLSTLTIGYAVDAEVYGSDGHYVTLNNASRYQLDALTAKMTTYLRELSAKFKAKCSSFVSTL